jgi:hypothetical protein
LFGPIVEQAKVLLVFLNDVLILKTLPVTLLKDPTDAIFKNPKEAILFLKMQTESCL